MNYKSSILAIVLLILTSGQAIAAETTIVSEFNPESLQPLSDIEPHWANGNTQISATSVKLSGFAEANEQLPNAQAELVVVSRPSISHAVDTSSVPVETNSNSTINFQQYLDMGYYSSRKELLWNANHHNHTQIAQTPEVAPPPPLNPSTPIATPTTAQPITPAIQTAATTSKKTEPSKWGYGIHTQLSTTGFIGADVGYKFSPNLNARLGINTIGFNTNYGSQGIDYNTSFSPTNIHLLGDYFPFGGGLRLTGGLVIQNNNINATGKSNSTNQVVINNTTYSSTDIGTLEAKGSFANSIAPYIGLGFGSPISPGLGFNLDAGVMFAGSPTIKLRATNPNISNQLAADIAAQEQKTNQDIQGFTAYPVISIGVSYAF